MSNRVREPAPARQASAHSPAFQLSALSLVSVPVIHGLTGRDLGWVTIVILVLIVVVVVPAVWSAKGYRRRARLDGLGGLILSHW